MIRMTGGNEIHEVARIVRTIPVVIDTTRNISEVMKASHAAGSRAFTKYMTKLAVSAPSRYGHMYEWNQVGLPQAALWKDMISGAGRTRTGYFIFTPSKTIVPVHPELAAVGVKKRHRFAMKAAVFEYGLEVQIAPRLAKVLVYLAKGAKQSDHNEDKGYIKDGIVYRRTPVTIQRAGNKQMWGAFTAAYSEWWGGNGPRIAIEETVIKKMSRTISRTSQARLAKVGRSSKPKEGSLSVRAIDPEMETKLIKALYNDYDSEILNRTVGG